MRVEAERGVDLVRSSHKGEDWIDVKSGKSYDAVGNFPAERLNLDDFFRSIKDHLKKTIDYVPVDVSQFSAEQRSAIRIFIDGLGDSRIFIVGDYGSGG